MLSDNISMKSTERFSTRVEAYREHRPRYPKAIVELLRRECRLTPEWVVADVAAGTGLLAEIFLDNGNRVIAVEPNGPMRAACEELRGHPHSPYAAAPAPRHPPQCRTRVGL